MKEIWKPIKGYEGLYEVSNLGRIKSLNAYNHNIEKIMSCPLHHSGYKIVSLKVNGKSKTFNIHRLVAETFIPNPYNLPCINHINEIKTDNRIENLEWCTYKYNCNYGSRNKKIGCHSRRKVNQYDLEGNFVKTWNSISEACQQLNCFSSGIVLCCQGKHSNCKGFIWRYID